LCAAAAAAKIPYLLFHCFSLKKREHKSELDSCGNSCQSRAFAERTAIKKAFAEASGNRERNFSVLDCIRTQAVSLTEIASSRVDMLVNGEKNSSTETFQPFIVHRKKKFQPWDQ
jgi:hypothetical protein